MAYVHVSLKLRDMCVPGNLSLPWITTLATQLSSPSLTTLEIEIQADSMQNLLALDSECGVRDRHLVPFDDLTALDWEMLSTSLTLKRFPALQRLILHGVGANSSLQDYLHTFVP